MEKINKVIVIPKNKINYQWYSLYLSKYQKEYRYQVLSLDNYYDLDIGIKSDYYIILQNYCFIDFKKLDNFLSKKPRCCAIKNKSFYNSNIIITKYDILQKFINRYTFDANKFVYDYKNITDISKICFLSNSGQIKGSYHNSIFVCLDDNSSDFYQWLNDFSNKKKVVFYNGECFNLEIGKTFFIKNNYHIGILPNKQEIFWDSSASEWKVLKNNKLTKVRT